MTQPTQLIATISHTNVLCFGMNNGTASVNASGGTVPYTYAWNTAPVQHGQTATNLSAGNYTLTVSDANGCTALAAVSVTQPTLLTLSISSTNASCVTCNDGSASAISGGGILPYAYSWMPIGGNGPNANNLAVGAYTCCVSDANGCSTCSAVTINSNCPIPTIQSRNITFSSLTSNSVTVHWINGNGSRRIVKIKPTNTFTAPQNGYDYTANPVYTGSGEQVVYNGTGNSVNVTGLSQSTYYWFRVYEATCTGNFSGYQSLSANGNPRRILTATNYNPNRPEGDMEVHTEAGSFNIIPNSAHGSFTVGLNNEAGNSELRIYDVTGREVLEQKLSSQSSIVNCSLRAGIYLVKVLATGQVYNRKLIIE